MTLWVPRKRTILGGTLAIGLIAGIWLSDMLPKLGDGFGLGAGGDGVLGKPDLGSVAVQVGDGSNDSESATGTNERPSKQHRTDAEPLDDVLTILVEDRHYAIWRTTRKGNGYFPAELDELVKIALESKPNDDGLRVRILRSTTARVTAWQKLQSELVQAGVPAEAIVVPRDLVK